MSLVDLDLHCLLARHGYPSLTMIETEILRSKLARGDLSGAEKALADWTPNKTAIAHKWIPGSHFHVFNHRFDTLAEAKTWIVDHGYVYGGLKETYVEDVAP